MNKTELVREIAEQTDMTMKDVAAVLDSFTDAVTKALKKGDKVQLIGFGSFEARKRAARKGFNPRNPKEAITIPASVAPVFKAGKAFKDALK